MLTLNKEKIKKEIIKGDLNKLLVLYGILNIFIGGAMGGDVKMTSVFLIVIPSIFIFIQKRDNSISWIFSLISTIYIGVLYYLTFPILNIQSLIFYSILIFTLYRFFTVKELFK